MRTCLRGCPARGPRSTRAARSLTSGPAARRSTINPSRSATAAFGFLEAWGHGQAGGTDAAALEALSATLKSLEASAWEPLFRAMARRLTPADLRTTVEQVLRGRA
ncbi:MAG: hypothetical protein SFW67_17625 [Myxococcaceae bacterium]|nr:hypothetical protein [Myxococcaceae bacterium]